MPATIFLLLVATVLSVDDDVARIDQGRLAGLRQGDTGTLFYQLKVGVETRRIDIGTGTLIEAGDHHSLLRFAASANLRPDHRVEFRIAVPLEAGQEFLTQVREASSESDPGVDSVLGDQAAKGLSAPPDASVQGFVTKWARAWSEQRVEDYLALYARNFRPPDGMRRGVWEEQRRQRISTPASITINVEQLEVVTVASRAAVATFVQHYRSETYQDRVPKLLDLVREAGEWRILEERLVE